MKRILATVAMVAASLLSGCASVVRNDVTAFHQWPASVADKSYKFARKPGQSNDLEYRHYETLVARELQQLEFTQAENAPKTGLLVDLDYGIQERDVTVIEPVINDPLWSGSPFFDPTFRHFGYYNNFANPLWLAPPTYIGQRETRYAVYRRWLKVTINRSSDNARLYQVTVNSQGRNGSLATVMPAMIEAAFTDFPGENGVTHQVDIQLD